MKKTLLIILIVFSFKTFAQDLPTKRGTGFAFPIESKFTIKLDTTDPENITYSMVKFETFTVEVDSWENDHLFDKKGEEGTIDFIFCTGTSGETMAEKEKNQRVHLLIKNRTKLALDYYSEIQLLKNGEYHKTSNVGCYPGAKGNEMWRNYIYSIAIRDFKIKR